MHIVFCELLRVDLRIEVVSVGRSPVLKIIGCEMLAGGNYLLVLGVLGPLEAADERSHV